jgi:hypothetical protein
MPLSDDEPTLDTNGTSASNVIDTEEEDDDNAAIRNSNTDTKTLDAIVEPSLSDEKKTAETTTSSVAAAHEDGNDSVRRDSDNGGDLEMKVSDGEEESERLIEGGPGLHLNCETTDAGDMDHDDTGRGADASSSPTVEPEAMDVDLKEEDHPVDKDLTERINADAIDAVSVPGRNSDARDHLPAKAADDDDDAANSSTVTTSAALDPASGFPSGERKDKRKQPEVDPPQPPSGPAPASSPTGAAASSSTASAASSSSAAASLPVMKGTFSYDVEQRRHLIRGMWNFENSTQFGPQRFELVRTLSPSEDLTKIPSDGEFHGSFSLAYLHTTSKGKQKERSKVISESGVRISFVPDDATSGVYRVDGKGTNQFGVFHINGTATPSGVEGDPTLHVVLRKRYEAQPVVVPSSTAPSGSSSVNAASSNHSGPSALGTDGTNLPLPPPSKSFPSGVVCLRGKLFREESTDLGTTEVVHRINGAWAAGLDVFLSDPDNLRKQQNRFEYEHKSSVPSTTTFPVSGRYSGWFDLGNEDGTRTRINERDVTIKFRKNSAGSYNVEGKGSNVFGKYNITGTLENDTITIFRHFLPRKPKIKTVDGSASLASTPGAVAGTGASDVPAGGALSAGAPGASPHIGSRRPSAAIPVIVPKLKLSDVSLPTEAESPDDKLEPTKLPANGAYSAVSRGVLRLNDDGSHSCQGKWAVTREHFTNGATSNFNFRLEAHLASAAAASAASGDRAFPIDSEMYKGSFQLKKQGSRYQTIIDQQLVLRFRMNSQGAYNVYGKGINAIGEFNLLGTLVMSGKTGGQVELYRMYPPDKLATLPGPKPAGPGVPAASSTGIMARPEAAARSSSISQLPGPSGASALIRRESTRLVKLPSKLEDDDPGAVISRAMRKCNEILQFMREKDLEMGGFFSEPVDPVALGIPTYHQIIKEPMDLRTIHRRMEAESIGNPEDFARLCRLVFENAMTFNVDPAHSVHQAARSLLVLFNQKYRDVERLVQNVRRSQDGDDKGKKKGKEDKKRKRQVEEVKSLKKRRLEEAQAMATANSNAVAAIVAAAPLVSTPNVTRTEFNMLLHMIQELQRQVVATHTAVAELSPGDEGEGDAMSVVSGLNPASVSSAVPSTVAQQPPPERKKSVKRKSENASSSDAAATAAAASAALGDSRPLTLDEQELLTETINDLPPEHLGGVIQIIREAAPVGADEDEIDLEIDQLDTKTQRKLLRHVSKVRRVFVLLAARYSDGQISLFPPAVRQKVQG